MSSQGSHEEAHGRYLAALSRETLVAHKKGGMSRWRKRLFSRMSRNSLEATAYFGIPPNRVVELGMQVQL